MPTLAASELGEFAFRVLESDGPNAWLVLVADGDLPSAARGLAAEIAALDEHPARVEVVTAAVDLERVARGQPNGIVIITGGHAFADADWQWIGLNRTRVQRTGTTVLVLDEAAVERVENKAPDFASWIGGNVWHLEQARPLDAAMTEQRLVALRDWARRDDADVLCLAEAGSLPPDPEYAEWLTLLGRGDLLAR